MNRNCIISGRETTRNFDGKPVDKEVLEFARRYRDVAINRKDACVRGVLNAFLNMKKYGHNWDSIKAKLTKELKEKGIEL